MKSVHLIVMLLLTTSVMAGPGNKQRVTLNLTAEQKEQMQVVKQRQHERMQAAREEIMAQSKTEMAAFLTAEQLEKWESMEAHRHQHKQLRNERKKERRQGRRHNQDGE